MIPARLRSACSFCGEELNIDSLSVYQFASGWLPNRAAGGANTIALAKREPKWAHRACIEKKTDGTFGQDELFKAPPDVPRPVEHWCVVCGQEAAFGEGVRLQDGELGRWFCFEHWPARY